MRDAPKIRQRAGSRLGVWGRWEAGLAAPAHPTRDGSLGEISSPRLGFAVEAEGAGGQVRSLVFRSPGSSFFVCPGAVVAASTWAAALEFSAEQPALGVQGRVHLGPLRRHVRGRERVQARAPPGGRGPQRRRGPRGRSWVPAARLESSPVHLCWVPHRAPRSTLRTLSYFRVLIMPLCSSFEKCCWSQAGLGDWGMDCRWGWLECSVGPQVDGKEAAF